MKCRSKFMPFTGQFSVLIGQKMQLTAWHHSNNIRSGTYMDTKFISVALLSNPLSRGGSRPMQPMRMHRSEFRVNLITRSRVSIETPKNNKIHNLISKCMRIVPREALLWYYRSKQ